MHTIAEGLRIQSTSAVQKVELLRRPMAFTVAGLFGGAYIGVGLVMMLSAAGPLVAAGDPLAKLVSGVAFSAGLVLVVLAGAELVTSTMMTAAQGVVAGVTSVGNAVAVLTWTFAANFVGALLFSAVVALSGVLTDFAAAGAMLSGALEVRAGQSPLELVLRGVLCNVLVCLAVWMCARLTHTGAKIAVIMVAISTFVASGFEHVVANMTIYWLGVFVADPNASATLFAGNMLWVGLGNLAGGLIVGLSYWLIGGSPRHPLPHTAEQVSSSGSGTIL